MTKFGMSQAGSPPPLWWRRFERAMIIGVAPATTAFLMVAIDDSGVEEKATAAVVFVTALLKSVGIFLGTDTEYPDAPSHQINSEE